MKKTIAILSILVNLSLLISAQDPHFSQFFASPLTLNPAFTGKFDGTVRAAGNYRNQWPAFNDVYTTFTASVDFLVLKVKPAAGYLPVLIWGYLPPSITL